MRPIIFSVCWTPQRRLAPASRRPQRLPSPCSATTTASPAMVRYLANQAENAANNSKRSAGGERACRMESALRGSRNSQAAGPRPLQHRAGLARVRAAGPRRPRGVRAGVAAAWPAGAGRPRRAAPPAIGGAQRARGRHLGCMLQSPYVSDLERESCEETNARLAARALLEAIALRCLDGRPTARCCLAFAATSCAVWSSRSGWLRKSGRGEEIGFLEVALAWSPEDQPRLAPHLEGRPKHRLQAPRRS